MTFKDTLMHRALEFPQLWVDSTNMYSALLSLPLAFCVFILFLVAALMIDFCRACYSVFTIN